MRGFLVVNEFLTSEKFNEIYVMFLESAKKLDINLEIIKTGDILHNIDAVKKDLPDFILFYDKDVLLARIFEACKVDVFNSSYAIETCDNKAKTLIALQSHGFKVPKTYIAPLAFENTGYNNLNFLIKITKELGFPCVIKPLYGSFGKDIFLANSYGEVVDFVESLGDKPFMVQEFIKSSKGFDVRINVVDGNVVSAIMRKNENGDFRSNITNGGKAYPYSPNCDFADMATGACGALRIDFAGVDLLFGENGEPIICEINSNPHFKSTFDCTGLDMSFDILEYIKKTVGKRHRVFGPPFRILYKESKDDEIRPFSDHERQCLEMENNIKKERQRKEERKRQKGEN